MSSDSKSVLRDLFGDEPIFQKVFPAALVPVEATKSLPRCTYCHETFLSDHDVAKRYRISRAAIWRWVKNNPDFPKPIKLSPGATRWKLSDLISFEMEKERGAKTRFKAKDLRSTT